jgi:hypothetical protein
MDVLKPGIPYSWDFLRFMQRFSQFFFPNQRCRLQCAGLTPGGLQGYGEKESRV